MKRVMYKIKRTGTPALAEYSIVVPENEADSAVGLIFGRGRIKDIYVVPYGAEPKAEIFFYADKRSAEWAEYMISRFVGKQEV